MSQSPHETAVEYTAMLSFLPNQDTVLQDLADRRYDDALELINVSFGMPLREVRPGRPIPIAFYGSPEQTQNIRRLLMLVQIAKSHAAEAITKT
jgi:hypothetical protein